MIELKDILINARQESHRMRHHYIGVEHLVIALLEIKGGLLPTLISEFGLTAEYTIEAIRRKAGKGSKHRLWAGMPNSPRAEVILTVAQELAFEEERETISERDLLLAILDEYESLPLRVLASLGVTQAPLAERARTLQANNATHQSFVTVELASDFDEQLDNEALFVLRYMFQDYPRIRVNTRLYGGYTEALLLVVTPLREDGREDASVVVKIGLTDGILDEAQRYERYVKNTLPPMTARLEDKPVAPEMSDLAGLKYTFLTDDNGQPRNLRSVLLSGENDGLGAWLHSALYDTFAPNWWAQSRPYRFEAWQEYDPLLPPVLTLDYSEIDPLPENTLIVKFPIRRNRLHNLEYGQTVAIDNFVVYKVDKRKNSLTLALGHGGTRAIQIEIHGINFDSDTYYRGELVERLVGRVNTTRQEHILQAARELSPDFDLREALLKNSLGLRIPNPFIAYQRILDRIIMGSISTIHGDLHAGNIMLGTNSSALLIDFAQAREGHTLFDWATLEVSLLVELLTPFLTDRWESVRGLLPYLYGITHRERLPDTDPNIMYAVQSMFDLRDIVFQRLAIKSKWEEYWAALAIVALRAVTWHTLTIPQRRLMTYVSGLAMSELDHLTPPGDNTPDATEFTNHTT